MAGRVDVKGKDAGSKAKSRSEVLQKPPAEIKEGKKVFTSGASRSADSEHVRFDLIPPRPHTRLAQRYAMGAKNHGDNNWRNGMPVSDIVNHLERHLNLFKARDTSDDHAAAIAWGAYALMEFELTHPEMDDRYKEPNP